MNRRLLITVSAILAVFALSVPVESQIQNTECRNAQTWHLQQAMKWSHADAQDFHLGAAQAAKELGTIGGDPCNGWKQDAQPPVYDNATGGVSSAAP